MFDTLSKETFKRWGLNALLGATTVLAATGLGLAPAHVGCVSAMLLSEAIADLLADEKEILSGKAPVLSKKVIGSLYFPVSLMTVYNMPHFLLYFVMHARSVHDRYTQKNIPYSKIRKLDPKKSIEGKVQRIVTKLCRQAGISVPEIYVNDVLSEVKSNPAAFRKKFISGYKKQITEKIINIADDSAFWEAVGEHLTPPSPVRMSQSLFGENTITILSTFLSQENLTDKELEAALAHEVWHFVNHDDHKTVLVETLYGLVEALAASSFSVKGGGLWAIAYTARNHWKKIRESQADLHGVQKIPQGYDALAAVLAKLEKSDHERHEKYADKTPVPEGDDGYLRKAVDYFQKWISPSCKDCTARIDMLNQYKVEQEAIPAPSPLRPVRVAVPSPIPTFNL